MDNFKTFGFTVAIATYISLHACTWVIYSICIYIFVCYDYALSAFCVTCLLFLCLGCLLRLRLLWLVYCLYIVCFVYIYICCTYIGLSTTPSISTFAMFMLVPRFFFLCQQILIYLVLLLPLLLISLFMPIPGLSTLFASTFLFAILVPCLYLLWCVCYSCAWVICSVYVFYSSFAIYASFTPSAFTSAMPVLGYPLLRLRLYLLYLYLCLGFLFYYIRVIGLIFYFYVVSFN